MGATTRSTFFNTGRAPPAAADSGCYNSSDLFRLVSTVLKKYLIFYYLLICVAAGGLTLLAAADLGYWASRKPTRPSTIQTYSTGSSDQSVLRIRIRDEPCSLTRI